MTGEFTLAAASRTAFTELVDTQLTAGMAT